jgi:predicted nucleic acid-binding protein
VRAIVADASALIDLLMRSPNARRINVFVMDPDVDIHIPALCDVEVLDAIRRAGLGRHLSETGGYAALDTYRRLPTTRHDHFRFLPRMFELRHNITAYDATYVALAEALEAGLLTEDKKLAKAARKYVEIV